MQVAKMPGLITPIWVSVREAKLPEVPYGNGEDGALGLRQTHPVASTVND